MVADGSEWRYDGMLLLTFRARQRPIMAIWRPRRIQCYLGVREPREPIEGQLRSRWSHCYKWVAQVARLQRE